MFPCDVILIMSDNYQTFANFVKNLYAYKARTLHFFYAKKNSKLF